GGRFWDGSLSQVAFFNTNLTSSQVQQMYNAAGIPPFMGLQPVSATINAGNNLALSAVAGGALPLGYQWYQNGSPLTLQTNTTLAFNPVQGTNAGNYTVIVTNSFGSVTSQVAVLTVFTNPVITVQPFPTNTILYAGSSAAYSVTAVGGVPLFYFWQSNS